MRAAVAAVLVVFALVPARADAKEGIERLRVCGSSGCRTISHPRLLAPLIGGLSGTDRESAPPLGSFFTLVPEPTASWPESWPRYVYVPGAQVVRQKDQRGNADWYSLVWTDGAYERATRGLAPFPEPVSWAALKTPARRDQSAKDESAGRIQVAIGAALALVAVGTAGMGVLRHKRRRLRD
jgi:hypothetical protein